MSFTYTTGIPATNNDPSVDQPDLLINTNSVNSLLDVDHVSFNAQNGGTHKQVRYSSKNTPGAQTDPQSTAFTANGTADPTVPQHFWKNSQGTYPMSALKAFTVITPSNVAHTQGNNYNIASLAGSGTTATITLNANTVFGNDVVVVATQPENADLRWTFVNPTLTLNSVRVVGVRPISVLVVQI